MSEFKPNIIYLHSHDTGRYISPYGHKVRTPNLQKFAEEGVVFRQCFCANPTCSPSRACLLTGEYAHSNGMLGLAHRGFEMNDYSKHLLHTLRDEGYKSYLLGIQHIISGDRVDEIGYDEVLAPDCSRAASAVAPVACDFLKNPPAEPFFLAIGTFETHREFPEHETEDDPRWASVPPHLPDTSDTRLDMARFNTMAKHYDDGVGMVLDCLEETGLAENTLVIITTDHGIAFPGMKCNLYDRGLGVLLLMRGPNGVSGGKVIDAMTSHVDVFPTICDYLGIDAPERLQGMSQMPVITGAEDSVRDAVFAEVNAHAGYEPKRCVRTERYKYIKRLTKYGKPFLANVDDGLSKDIWVKHGWADRDIKDEELYDLVFDPQENNNIIDRPELAEVVADLRDRMAKWMSETNDEALEGMPSLPVGALVCEADSPSPKEYVKSTTDKDFCKRNEIPY
jgi:N-sulfoglucosamine sulfohydrolase